MQCGAGGAPRAGAAWDDGCRDRRLPTRPDDRAVARLRRPRERALGGRGRARNSDRHLPRHARAAPAARGAAVTGGTAGLSLLLGYATGWPFWALFTLINVPFALLAVWRRGWSFTIRTVISIVLVSVWAPVHDALFPIGWIEPWYGTLAGNLLAGVGVLILFRHRSSIGGINIIGLEVQDRTGFRAGWTMMIFDLVIILCALWVIPWPNVVMSAAGAVLLNLVLALNHRPGRYLGH